MLILLKNDGFVILFFSSYDLQKRINDLEKQKEKTQEETKDINEKSSKLADVKKAKDKALKELEK